MGKEKMKCEMCNSKAKPVDVGLCPSDRDLVLCTNCVWAIDLKTAPIDIKKHIKLFKRLGITYIH